ncbi:MAG: serine/threonine-protein kinase, partial [Planctomycetota bacterium]
PGRLPQPSETHSGSDHPGGDIANRNRESRDSDSELAQVCELLGPTDDPSKLGRLGHYEVIGIVGTGATAVVLKALDGPLHRFVAIKLLRPTLAASSQARKRFSREARSAASIVHENVIEIFGVSEDEALPYLVMPYIAGESLAKRIERTSPMSIDSILHIACQVADGLQAAHEKSLMHRDIKPSNILLGPGVERLKLTDFGLARAIDDVGLTKTGIVAGTPEYMSPEQASGLSIDHRSDLFSLGSVLYTMCTGRSPFQAEGCLAVLRKITDDEPPAIPTIRTDVPDWLIRLVNQLMAKNVDDRPDSAAVVASQLRQCLAHRKDARHPLPMELQSEPSWSQRLRRPSTIVLVAFVAALSLLFWSWDDSEPSKESGRSDEMRAADELLRWNDGVTDSILELDAEIEALHRDVSDAD